MDKIKLAHTFALGIDPLPTQNLANPPIQAVANTFRTNVLRLKRMMLVPALTGVLPVPRAAYIASPFSGIIGSITIQ